MLSAQKLDAKRKKAAVNCAQKLDAASRALNEFLTACNECDDESRCRGMDDGRLVLIRNINEYAGYLDRAYNK